MNTERIEKATQDALYEFWASIAKAFPEAESGWLDPLSGVSFDEHATEVVAEWVRWNTPREEMN